MAALEPRSTLKRNHLFPGALRRALFCLLLVSTAAAPALAPLPAFAKDGGGHGGSGGGGSGGGSGGGHDGGSGGSGSGSSGGSGSGSSGRGGGEAGRGESGGHGADDARDGADGQRSGESRKGDDRRSDVVWSDRTGTGVELRYADGWSEAVRDSRYTLRDASRRVVVDRPARRADRTRLEAAMP